MKKSILIAAAAAMVLGSCSENTISENTSDSNAIKFGTYAGRSVTKAGDSFIDGTTAFPSGKDFGVYGYLTTDLFKNISNPSPSFMNNIDVQYAGENTNSGKFWPSDDDVKLTFYAYYPVGNSHITNAVTAGLGSYSVDVPTSSNEQPDFMLTDVVPDQDYSNTNSGTKGLVNLEFHHMLTQVKVAARIDASNDLENTDIRISRVTFSGIKNIFNVSPACSYSDPDGYSTSFANQNNDGFVSTEYPVDLGTGKLTTTSTTPTPGNTLLLAPQDLTDGTLTIVYSVTSNSTKSVTCTKTILLKDYTGGKWKSNQSISYSFTINIFDTGHPIKFTATVVDWTSTAIAIQ